jgi:hypothetical protein
MQYGVYVYGILPGDIELQRGTVGAADPPAEVRVVRHGNLAALVSDVDPAQPLGRPDDLFAHQRLLDAVATEVPVLPMRFGAVVATDDAVAQELLGAHHDELASALGQLEGHVEYVVKGRYDEAAILREMLEENPRAAQLGELVKDADPDATRELRMELGEVISEAVAAKRAQDTATLIDVAAPHVADSVLRPPSHELDAVYTAFLVAEDAANDLQTAVRQLGRDWQGRIELQLAGPLAAYDFTGAPGQPAVS